MNKAVVGLGLAAVAGAAFLLSGGDAKAGPKVAPNGTNFDDLALATTVSLTTQHIPDVRQVISLWKAASDPLTAGAIEFTLDGAVQGVNLAQWRNDGENGSPLLRAFGMRVFQLEGRPDKLRLWAKAWKTILPKLSEALTAKAGEIKPSIENGTTDDPVPDEETIKKIIQAVSSGNPSVMRTLADELDRRGFKAQAADLRAAAKAIEDGRAEPPAPPPPGPPSPGPSPSGPVSPKPQPVPPSPGPVTPPAPSPTNGAIYVVKSGDNPSKIAKAFTGNPNRWPELVKANVPPKKKAKDGNFATLVAGERLKIPSNWPAQPGVSPSAPVVPTPTSGATYVVKSGDNPSKIALALTGNANRWTELVAANSPPKKRAANGNFATLNAGEVLKLPASWPKAGNGAPSPSPSTPLLPAPTGGPRFYVVKSGDNPSKIAGLITGDQNRWRELVSANVPPKTKDPKTGNFKFLNAGEKLAVPTSWPTHSSMVFSGDAPAGGEAIKASRIALQAHTGKINRKELQNWQHEQGIEPNGQYGPATALCLCLRFGFVPPVPHVWGSNEPAARRAYAERMAELAKRDPQRGDEFKRAALQALGRAA